MRRRINLLALVVVAAGGSIMSRPAPASATYYNPVTQNLSCCSAVSINGTRIAGCCGAGGCYIKFGICSAWE
jgi:hypothetical protein